jgi:hypothetical protein
MRSTLVVMLALLATACLESEPANISLTDESQPTTSSTPSGADGEDPVMREMARCLEDEGWVVEFDGATVEVPGVVGEQRLALAEASQRCREEVGIESPNPRDASEEFIASVYAALLETASCLEDLGHQVPDPPSLSAFTEDWTSDEGPWHPYQGIVVSDPADWEQLNEACPQP